MAVPRNPAGHHVVHDEVSENRHADFEGDGKRDIIEYSKPGRHDGNLAFRKGTGRLGIWFGYLLFLKTAKKLKVTHLTSCYRGIEDTHTAASMNDCMSSWDVTSQWSGGTNGFLELRGSISH